MPLKPDPIPELRLPQDIEAWRRAFAASLQEAMAEAKRDGFVTAEQLLQEMDEIIGRASRKAGAK
jgi:hypothetical protein